MIRAPKFIIIALSLCSWGLSGAVSPRALYAQTSEDKNVLEQPIIVNGDTVEYSTDNKEISASGNVLIMYKGTKLTCDKITVNTQTKDAKAAGGVRIEDDKGVIEGQEIAYNFNTKTGVILDGQFRSAPYFGSASSIERLNDSAFEAIDGYASTCSFSKPHYRFQAKKIKVYPGDKLQSKSDMFYVGKLPFLYLPFYSHSLKDPIYHVEFSPGKSGAWGPYLLSAWRADVTDSIKGRVYLDYRNKLGTATGFGANYKTAQFGKGDFKFYYTDEKPKNLSTEPNEFQRYLVRLRHKWDIDPRTKATLEYYKIRDAKRSIDPGANFLKDYFFREYEQDAQPLTYALVTHAFDYSNLNLLVQKRTNRWFNQIDKLPELTYNLPDYQIGESPFYFRNISSFSNLEKKSEALSDLDDLVSRFDTYNQFSLPFKASVFALTPFVGLRETYYSQNKEGNTVDPRTVFYSGLDMSTKFYRVFDVNSDFLGMDLNGLRHIVTPSVKYAFNHEPTVAASKLQAFDEIDTITRSNRVTLELVNKFQTKRPDSQKRLQNVDLATLTASTAYDFKPKGIGGSRFSDYLFDIELLPYSWLRIDSDSILDSRENYFKQINVDLNTSLGKERSFGIGHRYERKGGKELTSQFSWRLSPKWRFRIYERYQFAEARDKGFKEQEYTFSRDLHCWESDFTYNRSKENGHTFWLVFRLKAFPETEFKLDQTYHPPRPGSQSNN
ncbi:MAG: LPS assembly protein LptD [Candidatus Omnitrophota bacterium]